MRENRRRMTVFTTLRGMSAGRHDATVTITYDDVVAILESTTPPVD